MRVFLLTLLSVALISTGSALSAPARWVVEDEDTTLLLYGSIHVMKPGTDWLDSGLRDDIARAQALYLETVQDAAAAEAAQAFVREEGLLKGNTLRNRLTDTQFAEVAAAFQKIGVPEAQIATLRPWFASVTLIFGSFAQLGYSPANGVDTTLEQLAHANGVPVNSLESPLDGVRLFADLDEETENRLLMETVAQLDDAPEFVERLTSAWLAGKVEEVATISNESLAQEPALMEPLLIGRNKNWAARLKALMLRPGLYVVVVGAAHLAGDGNLLSLMETDGITVRRVIEPSLAAQP